MVEFWLLAAKVPLGFCDPHTLSGPQPDEVGFELGNHGEDVEEQSPNWIGGIVNGPAQIESYLAHGQLVGDRPCVREGSRQSIEFGDHKGVAFSTGGQGLAKTRPFAVGTGQSVINVNPAGSHPERGEAVALGCEVLLISGYSGVSDE
jgi:hypothetical protein